MLVMNDRFCSYCVKHSLLAYALRYGTCSRGIMPFYSPVLPRLARRGQRVPGAESAVYECVVSALQSGEMLFGAPGSYNWRGNLFSNVLDDSLHSIARWRQSPVADALPRAAMPRPATTFYSYLGRSHGRTHIGANGVS